jgi:putative spermidine/putrescine transport system ATP-binding protein
VPAGLAGVVKAVMPLGSHVVYDVEIGPGVSLRISEPREGQTTMRQAGASVNVAPTTPGACLIFPAP